jgi:hypothetical protein
MRLQFFRDIFSFGPSVLPVFNLFFYRNVISLLRLAYYIVYLKIFGAVYQMMQNELPNA